MKDNNTEKDSFVFYKSWAKQIAKLNTEQKAALLDAVMEYQTTDAEPEPDDLAVSILFDCMREVFERNERNYKKNGAPYGNNNAAKKTTQNNSKTTSELFSNNQKQQANNSDDNDNEDEYENENEDDHVNEHENEHEHENEVSKPRARRGPTPEARKTAALAIARLNEKAGTNYAPDTKETVRLVQARLADGYGIEDFYAVIDKKTAEWLHDAKMCAYLRPSTLFCGRFEEYLHQKARAPDSRQAIIDQYAREAFEEESNDSS